MLSTQPRVANWLITSNTALFTHDTSSLLTYFNATKPVDHAAINHEDVTSNIHQLATITEAILQDREAIEADKTRLETENTILRTEKNVLQQTLSSVSQRARTPEEDTYVRRKTTDDEVFTAKDKNIADRQQQYVTWRDKIITNFEVDQSFFRTEFSKIHHVASRLSGDAFEGVRDHIKTIKGPSDLDKTGWKWDTHKKLLQWLDSQYETLNMSRQAQQDLDKLLMNNKPFPNFLAQYTKHADRCGRSPEARVEDVKTKISDDMHKILTTRGCKAAKGDFAAFCAELQSIWEDMQEGAHYYTQRHGHKSQQPTQKTAPTALAN